MLGENIKILRKQKGLSQETLAQQLRVVRQTVSKWEKGLSVPDAEMLNTLAELFEVPVSTLLGSTVTAAPQAENDAMAAVAQQLAILNEQLALQAARRRKAVRRGILGCLLALVLLLGAWTAAVYFCRVLPRRNAVLTTTEIECTLNGERYGYGVTYDENCQIYYAGGAAFIANHVQVEKFDDANELLAAVQDYFTDRGGTFTVTEVRPYNGENG